MKKLFSFAIAALLAAASNAQTIELPQPNTTGGLQIMETFANRQSTRDFSTQDIDMQTLADMLWATCGVNRPTEGKRTNPTAMNRQEIMVYVLTAKEACLYHPESNTLELIAEGDHRQLVAAGQDFVMKAPVVIVFVGDHNKFGMPGERSRMMVAVDAGIACENLCLYCAGAGLATVPRATMDAKELRRVLKLTDEQEPIMNNPVGYKAQ